MDEARKKIRMCLIFVVTVAVIIGLIYYFHDIKGNHGVTEGTLIKETIRDGGMGCGWKNG